MSPAIISSTPPPAHNGQPQTLKSSTKAIISPSSSVSQIPSNEIPAWVKPDLTRLLRVEHKEGSFASRAVSLVDLAAGAVFARITNPTRATCAYSSVQASRDLHIELNCDLVYINHSCRPSLVFDMQRWEVRVAEDLEGGLKKGDELTFFYPSTEWHMAQPFNCLCGTSECKGTISGARHMDERVLKEYWLSNHVAELLEEKIANGSAKNGS